VVGRIGNPSPVLPLLPVRLRQQRVAVTQRLSLKLFRHLDGSPLQDGDTLTLQAVAGDFDDVAPGKEPGRRHRVEIKISGRNALDILLNQEQAKVQQELVRLKEQERDALEKVDKALTEMKKAGKLTPEDTDKLIQAEQIQQQIKERVGANKEEGLRAEIARLQETLKNNQIPRSAVQERMEAVGKELDRLAREGLGQIRARPTDGRKAAGKGEEGA